MNSDGASLLRRNDVGSHHRKRVSPNASRDTLLLQRGHDAVAKLRREAVEHLLAPVEIPRVRTEVRSDVLLRATVLLVVLDAEVRRLNQARGRDIDDCEGEGHVHVDVRGVPSVSPVHLEVLAGFLDRALDDRRNGVGALLGDLGPHAFRQQREVARGEEDLPEERDRHDGGERAEHDREHDPGDPDR